SMKSVVFFFVSIAAFLLPFNFSVSATEIHGGNATPQVTQISQQYFAPLPPEYDSSFTAENYTSANVGWPNIQLWHGTSTHLKIKSPWHIFYLFSYSLRKEQRHKKQETFSTRPAIQNMSIHAAIKLPIMPDSTHPQIPPSI